MKYTSNEPERAGQFYCSECGYEQTPTDYCRKCHSRANAGLRYNTKSKVGRDGRRAGVFYRGPAEQAKDAESPVEVSEDDNG